MTMRRWVEICIHTWRWRNPKPFHAVTIPSSFLPFPRLLPCFYPFEPFILPFDPRVLSLPHPPFAYRILSITLHLCTYVSSFVHTTSTSAITFLLFLSQSLLTFHPSLFLTSIPRFSRIPYLLAGSVLLPLSVCCSIYQCIVARIRTHRRAESSIAE